MRAICSAFICSASQPVRIFSVTGTLAAATTADTIRATNCGSRISAAGQHVAHFLGRTAHIDVDDLRPVIHIEARRVGQRGRVGAGDLHADRIRLTSMIHPRARFCGVPESRVGNRHFRHHKPAPMRLHSSRKGLSVTPAIGASITFGAMV